MTYLQTTQELCSNGLVGNVGFVHIVHDCSNSIGILVMKVQVKQRGWSKAADCVEWLHPQGYYSYLLIAANGVVCLHHEWADSNKQIPEGEYDMPDEMFAYDNPRWEADEVIYE